MFTGDSTDSFANNGVVDAAGTLFTDNIRRNGVDLVTARINYRWGGPAIAKY